MAEIQSFQKPNEKSKEIDPIGWFFNQSIFTKSTFFALFAFLLISPIIFSNNFQAVYQQNASGKAAVQNKYTIHNSEYVSQVPKNFSYSCLLNSSQHCSINPCSFGVGNGKCPSMQPNCCMKSTPK